MDAHADHARIAAEAEAFLLRAGETPFVAALLAETVADAAVMPVAFDRERGVDAQAPAEYARGWLEAARATREE